MAESLYGNERKIVLENRWSPERYEQIVSFLSAQDFHILNASYWHAEQPWEVPKREISDNLIVIVHEGRLEAETGRKKAVLSPGDCMMVTPTVLPRASARRKPLSFMPSARVRKATIRSAV